MARAFSPAIAGTDFEEVRRFPHKASNRYYEVFQEQNRIVQRRYELDDSGKPVNSYQLPATHVVGSGNHARTYLHRTDAGEFLELPLTWYSQEKRWGMSPGFDRPHPPDFTRIVDDRCLFCHNGYPQANGELAQGIDCQRCHGPGSRHIAAAGKGNIVNPGKLSAELQLDVCMQCHLETTSAELPAMVRRFDRDVHSFRPGEPLAGYVVHFDEAPETGRPEKFEIASQAYRLRQSACFLRSGGRLTCTTCHNPHAVERGESAVAAQRANCRSCHANVSTPAHPALETANCAKCHMPQRRTEDAVHVVMTDHYIRRRPLPGNPTAPLREEAPKLAMPVLYYPAELPPNEQDQYLGIALIANSKGHREGIARLERQTNLPAKALAVLGEGYVAEGNTAKAIEVLKRASQQDPSLKASYNLGQAYEQSGDLINATAGYRAALQARAAFPEAEYALGNVLAKTGDANGAGEHYRNAIRLRPTFADAHSNLGALLADQRDLVGARTELELAIGIDPASAGAHVNLARVLAAQNDIPGAVRYSRRAVVLEPKNALAHYNLGQLLQHQNASAAALAEYRAAAKLQPEWPEAHLAMGQLLGDLGQLDPAIAEFREVLRLQPGNAAAQQLLNMALAMKQTGAR